MPTFVVLSLVFSWALVAPVLAGPVSAESAGAVSAEAASQADAAVALLAAACSGCHASADNDTGFPVIHGRPSDEIREAMRAFRSGEREGTVMNRLAKGYSDAEIDSLADYLARQEPPTGLD